MNGEYFKLGKLLLQKFCTVKLWVSIYKLDRGVYTTCLNIRVVCLVFSYQLSSLFIFLMNSSKLKIALKL